MDNDENIEKSLLEQVTSSEEPRDLIIHDIHDRKALRELRGNYSNFIVDDANLDVDINFIE